MGLHSLKKDSDIYMEALWISAPSETIHYLLHELYNSTFGCGKVANATVVLSLLDMPSSQKKLTCAIHSWCLKAPFQVIMEQTKLKEILPWPWGCRDCHKSSTGTQRSCSVCLCSQSWGQWKRFPGPWSHPGIPLLTYKHTVVNRGKRKPPHSVKETRKYYILIPIFIIKDPQTLDGLQTEESGNHTQLPLEWSY